MENEDSGTGANSPNGMVGISQELGPYDGGHQYHQQRLFQQSHHPHRHHNNQSHNRHHPYQPSHHHHHRHSSISNIAINDNNNNSNNANIMRENQTLTAPVTVHPNGHILHDRHPIHNRARIMALASTAGDQTPIPIPIPIHAIHQAAFTLSQQYRQHHQHHNQHHFSASGSPFSGQNPAYLHHHHHHHHQQGHHSHQQLQQQEPSFRQVINNHNQAIATGHPSAFLHAFTGTERQDVVGDAIEDGGGYDQEQDSEGFGDDGDGGNKSDDGDGNGNLDEVDEEGEDDEENVQETTTTTTGNGQDTAMETLLAE
ncbi:hypothetical protein BGX29_010218 [Mortierella sp. GBA35]|nr:hypothetical protein BGX29_010218 [Mortierella sp. GBA35]